MKKILLLFSSLLFCCIAEAQNLVLNPSFELYDTCPSNISQLQRAQYWTNPLNSTPDYYNSCSSNINCSVPSNFRGYQFARTGNGYAAIITSSNNQIVGPNNYREYIQGQLIEKLDTGMQYCITFYVSTADSVNFISNNIGIYFSPTPINYTCGWCPLPYTPQFENDSLNNLNDRIGWTMITGSYVAAGGEQFIIIGNFRDTNTTTVSYTGWVPTSTWDYSYYYIDDVEIKLCDSTTSVGELNTSQIQITPNPFHSTFTLHCPPLIDYRLLTIVNSLGQVVFQTIINSQSTIINPNLAAGVYFLHVASTSSAPLVQKLVAY